MKKIKKMNELSFSSTLHNDEVRNIKGGFATTISSNINSGCGFSTVLSGNGFPDPTPRPPKTNIDVCKCGCAGCIWEDGGAGFSVGMVYSHL